MTAARRARPALGEAVRALTILLAVALAGCGKVAVVPSAAVPSAPPPAVPAAGAAPDAATGCGDPAASLRPQSALPAPNTAPAGSYMRTVLQRGHLVVGVADDRLVFSARNAATGQIQGFDVDMARAVARALFGDPSRVELVPLPDDQRLLALESGSVDLVADALPITCAAARQVDFSTTYYVSGQRVLVPKESSAAGLQDLGGRRVCVPAGSPAVEAAVTAAPGEPIAVPAAVEVDCLVQLELDQVDAISDDETALLGLADQDRSVKIVGPRLTAQAYGLGVGKVHPDFVRYVNAVLQRMRTDGTWAATFARWQGQFEPVPAPPPAVYRD